MTTLLALVFMSVPASAKPNYLVGNCYFTVTDSRPNTIKIMSVNSKDYDYEVWYPSGWSETFTHSFESIETVYDNKRKCPDAK